MWPVRNKFKISAHDLWAESEVLISQSLQLLTVAEDFRKIKIIMLHG